MARQDAPTGILVARIMIPFAVVAVYWALRLHSLLTSGGTVSALVEWVVAIIVTMLALGVMGDALARLYRRIVD
ncbi:hypothetical protein ILP97_20360 [Amycolatopsis sp. H6(2020)]|nr:hypothetical protein [Amycolatopsis sp. H6(2020)]